MQRAVTQKDLARMLGINRTTVTRALNGHPDISESLRQRVLELSQSLGYYKNYSAASLSTQRTQILSILHSHNEMYIGDIHAQWITRLYIEAREHGYKLRLDTIKQLNEIAGSRSADGFIMLGTPEESAAFEDYSMMLDPRCNVVRADCSIGVASNAVPIDGARGTANAISYLIRFGHKSIAYLGYIPSSAVNRDRYQGYVKALNDNGIAAPGFLTKEVPFWLDDIEDMYTHADTIRNWIDAGVTAIYAPSDTMAIGTIKTIKRLGYSVPNDISVIGFDDGKLATVIEPRLTTVKQDIETASRLAIEMLLQRINGDGTSIIPSRLVDAPLIIRDSTAPPRNS